MPVETPALRHPARPQWPARPDTAAVLGVPLPHAAHAAEPPTPTPTLAHCAAIGASADRLICYDTLAGRAPAPAAVPAQQALPNGKAAPPAAASPLAAKDAPLPDPTDPKPPSTLLAKYWELDPQDKRGIFNFVGYRPNYALPLHLTSRINRTAQSPTQAVVVQPAYRREEAKFQLSLRTKLAQDLLLPGADVWVGFTQQVLWQIWNGKDSKPFRNSDYEPELMVVVPTPERWRGLPLDWQFRYTQLGLAHQSNGQSDPLSRSWNRVYATAGFEHANWSLTARLTQRLREPSETDNNPDLVTYRGRGEFQLGWVGHLQTANLLYRKIGRAHV